MIAGQTVFHAHVHLIPRYSKDDGFKASFTEQELDLKALQDTLTTLQHFKNVTERIT